MNANITSQASVATACTTAFIIPLRHPESANNYDVVLQLLKKTVLSLLGQSDPDIRIVIVCNHEPDIGITDSRLYFINAPFANPSSGKGASVPLEVLLLDKGAKLAIGAAAALSFQPRYFFFIDADDWIHQDTSTVMNKRYGIGDNAPSLASFPKGYYVNEGYLVNIDAWRYRKVYGLNRYCGSSFAYRRDVIQGLLAGLTRNHPGLPQHLRELGKELGTKEAISLPDAGGIAKTFERGHFYNIFADHGWTFFYLEKHLNFTPEPIPLTAICWIVDNGENHSATHLSDRALPFKADLQQTFSVSKNTSNSDGETAGLKSRLLYYLSAKRSQLTWLVSRVRKVNLY